MWFSPRCIMGASANRNFESVSLQRRVQQTRRHELLTASRAPGHRGAGRLCSSEILKAGPSFPCAWAFDDRRRRGRRQVAIGPPGLFGLVRRDDLGASRTIVSQDLDARLLPDSVAIGRLS